MAMNVVTDWSQLHDSLLVSVMDKLSVGNYVRCAAVCTSWGSVLAPGIDKKKQLHRSPPLLLTPTVDLEDPMRILYCPFSQKVCNFQVELPYRKVCRGSCFGWLITIEKIDSNQCLVQLCNPFFPSTQTINLPSLNNLAKLDKTRDTNSRIENSLQKAVWSASPTFTGNYAVIATLGLLRSLALFVPGNEDWIPIEWNIWHELDFEDGDALFDDVIYRNSTQQFCAVLSTTGEVFAIDIKKNVPSTTRISTPTLKDWVAGRFLVETPSGDLLQVIRERDIIENVFEVHLLDPIKKDWVQIHSLGDNALFLGNNSSMYLSAAAFPGCKPNCIYYNYSWFHPGLPSWYEPKDSVIFNLESKKTVAHYASQLSKFPTPAIWLEQVTKESL